MRYYKVPVRERTTERAHTEEPRPCFFGPFFLFVFRARVRFLHGQSGPSSVSLIARWSDGRGCHPPEGEREGEPLTGARARARTTRASALRGPRGPYPLGIYPDFYIADKVLATLGEGTFGKVVKVKDLQM